MTIFHFRSNRLERKCRNLKSYRTIWSSIEFRAHPPNPKLIGKGQNPQQTKFENIFAGRHLTPSLFASDNHTYCEHWPRGRGHLFDRARRYTRHYPFTMCLQPNGIEVVGKFGPAPVRSFLPRHANFIGGAISSALIILQKQLYRPACTRSFCQSPLRLVAWKGAKLQCINLMRVDVLILRINFKEPSPKPSPSVTRCLALCKFTPSANFPAANFVAPLCFRFPYALPVIFFK